MRITIAERLTSTKNRPAGFDWMRIVLASSIVAWHSIVTSYGLDVQHTMWTNPVLHPLLAALLAMFFALSGFLVAGSLERCRTIVSFTGLRIMRIFPALVAETLLSAFILGPLLTHFDQPHYFAAPELRDYLLNVIGLVHFILPGLFAANPFPNIVNAQLWTVPYELRCYEIMIAISILGIYARKWLMTAVIVLLTSLIAANHIFNPNPSLEGMSGNQLVLCFLCGVLIFRFRSLVPWNSWVGGLAAVAALTLFSITGGADFVALPISYLTVYVGLLNPSRVPVLFSGDYSYGLFLYGFPVQQAVASSGPWAQHWYISLAVAFPLTALIAVGSWWLIEKPVLSRKKELLWLEDKALVAAKAGRMWWDRRAAGRGAPFDRSTIGPAENRER